MPELSLDRHCHEAHSPIRGAVEEAMSRQTLSQTICMMEMGMGRQMPGMGVVSDTFGKPANDQALKYFAGIESTLSVFPPIWYL